MNTTALIITIAYSAVCVVAAVFMLWIWRSTHSADGRRDESVDTHRLERGEKSWVLICIAALGILLLVTLPFIPYGKNSAEAGQQRVNVEALQFAWVMDPPSVAAGVPARFSVISTDVSHGFAVYDEKNVMQFQVQVLPDHSTDIVHTFEKPGRYQIVCLEFCGVGHHKMVGTLTVRPS